MLRGYAVGRALGLWYCVNFKSVRSYRSGAMAGYGRVAESRLLSGWMHLCAVCIVASASSDPVSKCGNQKLSKPAKSLKVLCCQDRIVISGSVSSTGIGPEGLYNVRITLCCIISRARHFQRIMGLGPDWPPRHRRDSPVTHKRENSGRNRDDLGQARSC